MTVGGVKGAADACPQTAAPGTADGMPCTGADRDADSNTTGPSGPTGIAPQAQPTGSVMPTVSLLAKPKSNGCESKL